MTPGLKPDDFGQTIGQLKAWSEQLQDFAKGLRETAIKLEELRKEIEGDEDGR